MPYVPLSSGGASTFLDANLRHVQPLHEGLARNPHASRLASQGFEGRANRIDFSSPRQTSPLTVLLGV